MMMPAASASQIKILVADDQRVNQQLLATFLNKEGHTVVMANNGSEAVELYHHENPDLILLDIMMPVMDGLEAARRINEAMTNVLVRTPILFLSAMDDKETTLEGLALGNDFIQKPIDFTILRAKLRAFIRLVQIQRTLKIQQQRIASLNEEMRSEAEVALHVLERVLAHTEPPDGHSLQYKVVPSSLFSGDLVLARRTPSGRLHLLLADAVGHGLPAAINIFPLFFPFDGMSRKGFPLATVARELNRRVRDLLPVDRFVAATLISVDAEAGLIEVWNGGNPPVLLVRPDGRVKTRVDSMQMALGINDDDPGLFEPHRINWAVGDQVIVFSDGIWENAAFAGDDPASAVEQLLAAVPASNRMDALIEAAASAGQSDDISVVVVTQQESQVRRVQGGVATTEPSPARLSLNLGVEALKQEDIVDVILSMARGLGFVGQFSDLPSIFTELFANALEHGVLAMSSESKYRSSDGYLDYFEEKRQRLDALGSGFIAVEMEKDTVGGKPVLRLMLSDSGKGFDERDHGHVADGDITVSRGLTLVRSRVLRLTYNNQGNELIALLESGEADNQKIG